MPLRLSWLAAWPACFLATGLSWPATGKPAPAMPPPTPAPPSHWAFQSIPAVPPPAVRDHTWIQSPVDRFILARLEAAGLKPAPPASPEQWVRRLTFDLTGLPPTPADVDAFVKDPAPDRLARLVDRLLASPHYGERWARHWLDLARYAETDGFEHDAVRPHTWRYRDYVVQAFNEDKPYDRFLLEQLAGDELWPDDPAALVATGFNLLGPDMVDSADQIQRRLNTLNDMTDTAAAVFLGLTFGCARCHDHKSEPFTQRDYFSFQAFFTPATFRREHPVPTAAARAAHQAAQSEYDDRTRDQRRAIEELEAPYRRRLFDEKLARLSEDVQRAHRTPPAQRTMEQEGTVQETAPQVKVTEAEVTKALSKDDKSRRAALEGQLKRVPKPAPLPLAAVLGTSNGPPPVTHVLARGDYNQPREAVTPGFPAVLDRTRPAANPSASTHPPPDRRAALARWMASPDHPLTARVMVNRIWQHHFGRGLVATPGDFGTRGAAPSHPELLDWLAGEFIRNGWSVKHLHRVILLSATWQQSSTAPAATLAADPDNRLFSRQNRQRLEGEVLRDSLLAISGRLNPALGGPSVFPALPADLARTTRNWTASPDPDAQRRRSLYIFARRNLRFPFLEVFDAPDSNLSCPERGRSTTAPQALTLLNSAEVMDAAKAAAALVQQDAATGDARIEAAFLRILGRAPSAAERTLAREFLEASARRAPDAPAVPEPDLRSSRRESARTNHPGKDPPGPERFNSSDQVPKAPTASADPAWVELCRSLFNLNAFVYVE